MRRWAILLLGVAVVGIVAGTTSLAGNGDWFSSSATVVGSGMSHGSKPMGGVLDNGDIIRYARIAGPQEVTPAVAAQGQGHGQAHAQVAGDAGDVLVILPGGPSPDGLAVPRAVTERRALIWVAFDEQTGLFDVPELGLRGVREVTIPSVGAWDATSQSYIHRDFALVLATDSASGLSYPAGAHSGWVTKGDWQAQPDQQGPRGWELVPPGWVQGKVLDVVDMQLLVIEFILGVCGAMLLGVSIRLVLPAIRAQVLPRLAMPRPGALALPRTLARYVTRAAGCDRCGTRWADLPFCSRCGVERYPPTRYRLGAKPPRSLRAERRR